MKLVWVDKDEDKDKDKNENENENKNENKDDSIGEGLEDERECKGLIGAFTSFKLPYWNSLRTWRDVAAGDDNEGGFDGRDDRGDDGNENNLFLKIAQY